ncbi:MAG: SRPBCC family protein [Spirochaetia bacterium]|nr:SRPBCC family protein [Spirochaetia bacterium]
MKSLKILFIGVVAVVAIFLIGAAFLPVSTTISKTIFIASSPESVYKLTADFHKWNSWSHWSKIDPDQKIKITGPDMKVGSEMSWEGKKTGDGKLIITATQEGKSLTLVMITKSPREGSAINQMTFKKVNDGTEFNWVFLCENKYPVERWTGLLMKSMLKKAFEDSMGNIKTILENKK